MVIALASRSIVQIKKLDRRQVSQWAFGLAGVRIPSPAPFYQFKLVSRLFLAKNLALRVLTIPKRMDSCGLMYFFVGKACTFGMVYIIRLIYIVLRWFSCLKRLV